ncbi:MAG: DUF222 domain-containing protein [Actinomycetota bacterium]
MTALLTASDSQMAILADLVAGLQRAEQTLSSVQAARDGMLALASRLAIEIAGQSDDPDYGDMSLRAVAAEIGAAQRISDRVIERRMTAASSLVERFPHVWASQGAGRITAAHARVITDAGAHLSAPDDCARYAVEVVAIAERESPNRLRRTARRLAERFQPRSATERHLDARTQRSVWVKDLDDGMSELGVYGPSTLVHGIHDRLSQMAHAVHSDETRHRAARGDEDRDRDARDHGAPDHDRDRDPRDRDPRDRDPHDPRDHDRGTHDPDRDRDRAPRSIGQLRFDLLADLALTATPTGHDTTDSLLGAIRARVEVTVPVTTLMTSGTPGGDRHRTPAELDGACAVDLETTATLAAEAPGWERVMTHPITGTVLVVDRYRPGEALRRHLRARDQRCRFPACGLSTRRCDIDHTHAAASGGATSDTNLAHLCRRHHMLKHHSPWRVRLSSDGGLEWRSPAGRTYTDRAPAANTVTFKPSHPSHSLHPPRADLASAPF